MPVGFGEIFLLLSQLSASAREQVVPKTPAWQTILCGDDDDDAPDTANSAHDVEEDALESAAYL